MKRFVGFGFGPIQSGLFLYEAWHSGNFDRFAAAEVDGELVSAVRKAGGVIHVNVASEDGIRAARMDRIELYSPRDPSDAAALGKAIAEADELATALPSVAFYDQGNDSVAALLAANPSAKKQLLYAGENHNEAAEILGGKADGRRGSRQAKLAILNTVIGKMCGVVREADEIERLGLTTITPDLPRAVLVEAWNRILISKNPHADIRRGITTFAEKEDLLPFEEAKLFGHNAVHFSLACLAARRGLRDMSELRRDGALLEFGRGLFREIGEALLKKHRELGRTEPLFIPAGWKAYGEDLLTRMTNPFLVDRVDRVSRDPMRKLAPGDRILGAMETCLAHGVEPEFFSRACAAALDHLAANKSQAPEWVQRLLPEGGNAAQPLGAASIRRVLQGLWKKSDGSPADDALVELTIRGHEWLEKSIPR